MIRPPRAAEARLPRRFRSHGGRRLGGRPPPRRPRRDGGAEEDILIDGDLQADASKPVLGLIANRFVRVKHDVYGSPCRNNTDPDSPHRVREDYYIEAAILALKDSFVIDHYQCGAALGTLTVKGAIAQKFRGPVGTFFGTTLYS